MQHRLGQLRVPGALGRGPQEAGAQVLGAGDLGSQPQPGHDALAGGCEQLFPGGEVTVEGPGGDPRVLRDLGQRDVVRVPGLQQVCQRVQDASRTTAACRSRNRIGQPCQERDMADRHMSTGSRGRPQPRLTDTPGWSQPDSPERAEPSAVPGHGVSGLASATVRRKLSSGSRREWPSGQPSTSCRAQRAQRSTVMLDSTGSPGEPTHGQPLGAGFLAAEVLVGERLPEHGLGLGFSDDGVDIGQQSADRAWSANATFSIASNSSTGPVPGSDSQAASASRPLGVIV